MKTTDIFLDKFSKKTAVFFEKTDVYNRISEFRKSVKLGKRAYDVVLPWSHYHNLQSEPVARVFDDPAKADEYAIFAGDKIITADLRSACFLAATFDILCAFAWTSNQSSDESAEAREICEIALKFLCEPANV